MEGAGTLATLVTMADGLIAPGSCAGSQRLRRRHMSVLPPVPMAVMLVVIYFFAHYLFASMTAHVTAMMPIMLSVGAAIPDFPLHGFAMLLALSHGLMGILTPHATTSGPGPPRQRLHYFERILLLGAVFGAAFLIVLLALSGPSC